MAIALKKLFLCKDCDLNQLFIKEGCDLSSAQKASIL